MKSYKIKFGLVLKDISYKTFLEIIHISNIDKNIKFNYFIKINLGVNLCMYKKYYNYSINRIIKKIYKFNTEIKENKHQDIKFSYIILKTCSNV